jgi:molybdenum cofactor cytidylyltransferase
VSADFAVVLAAGRSRRMGTDKAGIKWIGGQTLLEWTVARLKSAGWFPIVVVGPHNKPGWASARSDLKVVCNAHVDKGKTTSIATGVAATPADTRSILIVSVDQPRTAELYRSLMAASKESSALIVVPDKHGRNGHPIALKAAMRGRLMTLTEAELGLRGLLNEFARDTYRVPCDPDELVWNCNTPADYLAAREWFAARASLDDPKAG